jgi:hypothetical protein
MIMVIAAVLVACSQKQGSSLQQQQVWRRSGERKGGRKMGQQSCWKALLAWMLTQQHLLLLYMFRQMVMRMHWQEDLSRLLKIVHEVIAPMFMALVVQTCGQHFLVWYD